MVQLETIGDSSLVEDASCVLFNGVFCDVEMVSDVLVRHRMPYNRRDNLKLFWRQAVFSIVKFLTFRFEEDMQTRNGFRYLPT